MKILVDKSIELKSLKIFIVLIKLHKSYLLLISDQEELGIGSVTLGTPSIIEGLKSPASTYDLFGMKKEFLSKIISEKVANALKAPVLLLIFIKSKIEEESVAKPLISFINEILSNLDDNH